MLILKVGCFKIFSCSSESPIACTTFSKFSYLIKWHLWITERIDRKVFAQFKDKFNYQCFFYRHSRMLQQFCFFLLIIYNWKNNFVNYKLQTNKQTNKQKKSSISHFTHTYGYWKQTAFAYLPHSKVESGKVPNISVLQNILRSFSFVHIIFFLIVYWLSFLNIFKFRDLSN